MSVFFSRRQSLKMMGAAGLISALPIGAVSASEAKHAFFISNQGKAAEGFGQAINDSMDVSPIQVNLSNYSSFLSLADLPEGSLLIGLVTEAEKVLIDALVQNRRGIVKTTARISATSLNSSNTLIPNLAASTMNSALSYTSAFTSDNYSEENQNSELAAGSLISFYAYL